MNGKSLRTLATELLQKRILRQIIADRRLELGAEHGKINRQVVALEEELVSRFPGEEIEVSTKIKIGKTGCEAHDRIKIED